MKSVCISVVRNEADIIECFVRHTVQVFDYLIVVNHRSLDGTGEILRALAKEGLPLEVRYDDTVYHVQPETMTKLAHEVYDAYKPDFLMALDADEFLILDVPFDKLIFNSETLFALLFNFVPTREDPADENPLKRIQYRSKYVNSNQHKVLVPGRVLSDPMTYYPPGCHEMYYGTKDAVPYKVCSKMRIAHFPVRSEEQIMKKAFVFWLSKLASPLSSHWKTTSHHWKVFYERLKKGERLSFEELQRFANGYTADNLEPEMVLIKDPVPAPPMKYLPKQYTPLEALADAAELLAFTLSHHKCLG